MKALAERGNQVLVDLGDDQGQIYDRDEDSFGPAMSVHSILGRGYWEDASPETEKLVDAMQTEGDVAASGRRMLEEFGLRWKFNPKQPRLHGKWAGPSAIEATPKVIQEKAHLAFVKVWGGSAELHGMVKEHFEANPKVTAAAIKQKLIWKLGPAHPYTNYAHVLATLKQVKGEKADELAKAYMEEQKHAPEPPTPKLGFNGSGHVGFGGTEALGIQAKDAGEAAKWFKPGDKVYAFTYTGNKLVPGVVKKVETQPLPGTGIPVGFVHVQPLVGGPESIHAYNEMAVAHADVIDSLDAKALKLHAEHSGMKRVQAAYTQAAKQTHLTHNFEKKTDAQLAKLDKEELGYHMGQAITALGPNNAYTNKVLHLVNPASPEQFLAHSDHDLELMSGKQLVEELDKASKALGPNHPYTKKVKQFILTGTPSPVFEKLPDSKLTEMDPDTLLLHYQAAGEEFGYGDPYVTHVGALLNGDEEEDESGIVPEPEEPAPAPPPEPEWPAGSLEEAVAKHLKHEPNATSARIKELLAKEASTFDPVTGTMKPAGPHANANYSRILAAVKKVKAGTLVSGTSGPVQAGALVPEEAIAQDVWSAAPGTHEHPAILGASKMEKTFPQSKGYGGVTEGMKRTQKRKICADIAKRLFAKAGTTYDQQLFNLARGGVNPEGKYISISTDGILEVSSYHYGTSSHLYGTPQATELIRRAGISKLVAGWAATSNDSRPSSLVMQEAVAGELGLTKTAAWAKLDSSTKAEMAKLMTDGTYELCRQVARCMYEATQQNLKANGITQVKLYRGVKAEGLTAAAGMGDVLRAKHAPGGAGKVADITLRPISSWAFSKGTAQSFGYGGAVFTATVPAERIFSTAVTGFGCLNEHEVVVLGGQDKVLVVTGA